MKIGAFIRENAVKLIVPMLFGLFMFILLEQIFSTDRGFMAWQRLRAEVLGLREKNAALEAEVNKLQANVDRLRENSLDEDFVDENIRQTLPVTKHGEQIIYLEPATSTTP